MWFLRGIAISAWTLTPSIYRGLGLVRRSTRRFTCYKKRKTMFCPESDKKGKLDFLTNEMTSDSTSWESMSTKQRDFAPLGFPFTKRTFLSSRYAKGSKAFKMVSTVVVGFTFFIIIATKKETKQKLNWNIFLTKRNMKQADQVDVLLLSLNTDLGCSEM